MDKIIIASYRTETLQLLDALQQEGIVELLDAERAMVSKEWPELETEAKRPRNLEDMVVRLEKAVAFLKDCAVEKDSASLLRPQIEVDKQKYTDVVSSQDALKLLDEAEAAAAEIDKLNNDYENCSGRIDALEPWHPLETPVEEISSLQAAACISGLVPTNNLDQLTESLSQFGATIQQVGPSGNMTACLTICMADKAADVQKALRAFDFEAINFEGLSGTVKELLDGYRQKFQQIDSNRSQVVGKAAQLASQRLKLQILFDHYQNLLSRESVRSGSAASDYTILLEGWVAAKDYNRLTEIVSGFEASTVNKMDIAEGEEIPVEIKNNRSIRPFEMITRLYGMPQHFELDPTALLAPFFAVFFALCLTDAGYGLIIIAFSVYLIKKMQGDKKMMWLLIICSVLTLVAGALTGGWFGDGAQQLSNAFGWTFLADARLKMMWFDPLEEPMIFFKLAVGLGYLQIMVGLFAAFIHNLIKKDVIAAVCDQLSWIVMLNSIVLFGAGKMEIISPSAGALFGKIALLPAAMILLFSQREGGIGARLGMGAYNLFSTIFYMGDVLSYLRLMSV